MKSLKQLIASISLFSIALCGLVFLDSCGADSELKVTETYDSAFVSSERILKRRNGDLQGFLTQGGFDVPLERLSEDVTLYRVNYTTTYQGAEIEASGLVIIPDMEEGTEVSILSFQHGTITADDEAPTTSSLSDLYLILYAAAASPGMVVVVPDYIGYGATKDIVHPYYIAEPTVTAVLDNIRAGREFMETEGLKFDGRLFLAGYSQGGYATMAVHQAIEATGFEDYQLIASYPAAGGYTLNGQFSVSLDDVISPVFTVFRTYAYLSHYETDYTLTDFFNEPYATDIPKLYDGELNTIEITEALPDTVGLLYNHDYILEGNTSEKYAAYRELVVSNDVTNWVPGTKMIMFHSNQDQTVSVTSSEFVAAKFKAAGSASVELVLVDGGDHLEAVVPYVELVFNDLLKEL